MTKTFTFLGKTLEYLTHDYNKTTFNERTVEIPIVWEYVKEYKSKNKNILEIGNVLSHYFEVNHDIVDKDEIAPRVINQDVINYKPNKKYDLIVSISTMEHVGHFELPGSWVQPQKVLIALQNLKRLLNPDGQIIITFGIGYNYLLDAHIKLYNIKFDKMVCMRRISKENEWVETTFDEIKNDIYGQPFNASNNIVVGFINKSYPKIPSATPENMEQHYNAEHIGISYENKVVLDLGASNGDSAEYFLHMGAKSIIAVEGNLEYEHKKVFEELIKTSELYEEIIPIFMFIDNEQKLENLILEHKPDIIKCDIEGAEKYLYNIKDDIWRIVPEYILETHEGYLGGGLDKLMYEKCAKTNYKIISDTTICAHVIYAKREE